MTGCCRLFSILVICIAGLSFPGKDAFAGDLRLATTTSTDNSGLLAFLLPAFHADEGITVRVISVGTGKALKLGENGDVDLVLVHSRPDEDRFIAQGHGVNRRDVMYNDFVLVGPANDPAALRGMRDAIGAFDRIADAQTPFVSRGDDSGTHKMELRYWAQLERQPEDNAGYRSAGRGMGEVLLMASELRAYALTDRATFFAMRNKLDLEIMVEGDTRLFNPYGVMAVNPAKYPDINFEAAMRFINWLTSAKGRQSIAAFRIDGKQLFFPGAGR